MEANKNSKTGDSTTLAQLVTRLGELPQTAKVASFELVYTDKLGNVNKIEYNNHGAVYPLK